MFKTMLAISIFSFSFAMAQTPSPVAEKSLQCEGGAGPRKLAVVAKEKGCELQYTKSEKTDVIATQKMGSQFCEEKLEKVKAKLEGSGYKCQ